jgi:hypothetical protein
MRRLIQPPYLIVCSAARGGSSAAAYDDNDSDGCDYDCAAGDDSDFDGWSQDGLEHFSDLEVGMGRMGFKDGDCDSSASSGSSSSAAAAAAAASSSRGLGAGRGSKSAAAKKSSPSRARASIKRGGGSAANARAVAAPRVRKDAKVVKNGGKMKCGAADVVLVRGGGGCGLDDSIGSSSSVELLPQDDFSPPSRIIVPETPPSPKLRGISLALLPSSSSAAAAAAPRRTRSPSPIVIGSTPSPVLRRSAGKENSGKENAGTCSSPPASKVRGKKGRESRLGGGRVDVVMVSSGSDGAEGGGSEDDDMLPLRERVLRMMKNKK